MVTSRNALRLIQPHSTGPPARLVLVSTWQRKHLPRLRWMASLTAHKERVAEL